jgi:hypothetical protein
MTTVRTRWQADVKPLGIKDAALIMRPIDPNNPFAQIPGTHNPREAFAKVYGEEYAEIAVFITKAADAYWALRDLWELLEGKSDALTMDDLRPVINKILETKEV